MRSLLMMSVAIVSFSTGCSPDVPVSKVTDIQFREASETQQSEMQEMSLYGTDRKVYVSSETILSNDDISTVSKIYDQDGNSALIFNFTQDGSIKVLNFTRAHLGDMMALVIDDHLIVALKVNVEISDSAMISPALSEEKIDHIFTMLTATDAGQAGD